MEEIKFKIRNTEAANIEIVPCADGVEIIVHYGQKKPVYTLNTEPETVYKNKSKWAKSAPKKANAEILKEFCAEKKTEPEINLKELTSFYKFYEDKAEMWKGTMDCEKLWDRWLETAK